MYVAAFHCRAFFSGLVMTGELLTFAAFVHRFPFVLMNIFSFSIASSLGQVGWAFALSFVFPASLWLWRFPFP